MAPRRPPDLLRKSHAHTEGRSRDRQRRELDAALDEGLTPSTGLPALLIDLDGVIYRGEEAIEGAADAVQW